MMRIVIIEDEPIISSNIQIVCERAGYIVAASFDNGEEAIPFILSNSIDLVLLDIELAGQLSGIQVAERLRLRASLIFIFLTSYMDQATLSRAKLVNPAAYIVKPFQESNLLANIELALFKGRSSMNPLTISANNKIFIKKGDELTGIELVTINYIEAYDNYAHVYTDSEKLLLTQTLKSIEDKLQGYGFIRVHKSYLVNIHHVTAIQEGNLLIKDTKIPLGKVYKKNLIEALMIL
jgi:DNA-binding LytR/AlgR family response regulator